MKISKKSIGAAIRHNYKGWLCTAPVTLGILIFTVFPLISSLVYSFTETNVFLPPKPVGFDNFVRIFTEDWRYVWKSLSLTFVYTFVSVPLGLILSYLLANLLNVKSKGAKAFRVIYYFPCIIPAIVSGLIWKDLLRPDTGLANAILTAVGLPASQFFLAADSSLPTLIGTSLFGIGGGMIMWLAQLKAIPNELYEAAMIDGSGKLRRFFTITIPLSTPMIFYNLVVGIIGSLQVFANVMIITGEAGGVDDSLLFYVGLIYRSAFQSVAGIGYAAALSWILFLIIAFLTFLMFKTSKWVHYNE